MKIRCIELYEDGTQKLVSEDTPSDQWLLDERPCWLDVEGATAEELDDLLRPLNLSDDVLERCKTQEQRMAGAVFGPYRYLQLRLPHGESTGVEYLSVLFRGSLLVTIHGDTSESLTHLVTQSVRGSRLPVSTTTGILFHILTILVEIDVAAYFHLRDRLDATAESVEDSPRDLDIDLLGRMKRRLAALLSNCEDQIYVQSWLWDYEQLAGGTLAESLRISFESLQQFNSVLRRSEMRLQDLLQQYQLSLQETTNNRLRALTVLSAIFMPLTLISGIYGMNFQHMPELDERFAYFAVLSGMGVISAIMLLFFYLKGWFK